MKRIIVVDDLALVRKALVQTLKPTGADIMEFADTYDALSEFQQTGADVVTLSILVPRMGGLRLGERLQAIDPSVALVFISGCHDFKDDALNLGGNVHWVDKPWSAQDLLDLVRGLL